MEPKLKKQKGDEEEVGRDRLSEMPDQIIVHILSFLSTLDAVRTMVIRPFSNLWTSVPSLSFDCEKFDETIFGGDEHDTEGFACFVSNVLMLHRNGTIDGFRLNINHYGFNWDSTDDIEMWLTLAVEKEAKYIMVSISGCELVPPPCVFTSQFLVKLVLSGCIIEPQHQVLMESLRKLKLDSCVVSNEAFNQLISGCPSLQEVDLEDLEELQDICITTPSVEKLRLDTLEVSESDDPYTYTLDCPGLKTLDIAQNDTLVDVIDVSSLQKVIIRCLPDNYTWGDIFTFWSKFRDTEVFTLSGKAFERREFPRNRWKRLVLKPWWNHRGCHELICKLLKSCTKLEELVMYTSNTTQQSHGLARVVTTHELFSPCEMPQLKSVTIYGYKKGGKRQLQVVQFFLENAVSLEKLIVVPGKKQLDMQLRNSNFLSKFLHSRGLQLVLVWSLVEKESSWLPSLIGRTIILASSCVHTLTFGIASMGCDQNYSYGFEHG